MAVSVGILGYGRYVPDLRVTNEELALKFGTTAEKIERKAGIKARSLAPPNIATSDMAALASLEALKNTGTDPSEIGMILVATTTPDMVFPSTACLVQKAIGAKNAAALDISAACTGFMYGLDMAACYVSSGRFEKVLLIGAETYSRITNPDDLNTSVLFGDGAGAVVIGHVPDGFGVLDSILGAEGEDGMLLSIPAGGSRMPLTRELLENKLNTIMMSGREVFEFAINILEKMINQILSRNSLNLSDISLIVPHQANKRILLNVSNNMNIPPEKLYCNIEYYGNMSAASVPVALTEAAFEGRIKKGDLLLLVAFGAGFTWGANLLKWGW
jgi:3-oxoacyl-[acyl-carrier-protein] synthase-3